MAKQTLNDIKLGLFVIAGVVVLIFALYMIGRNRSLFTGNFVLKARFSNAEGLMPGNNVRYAGIQTGTVKGINIINDTTIEVTMVINEKTGSYIKKNAIASIGNEGLMGNKVVNIVAGKELAGPVDEGDLLATGWQLDMNNAMSVLSTTNNNAGIIASELAETVKRINSSPVLWQILADTTLPENIGVSLKNIRLSSERLNHATLLLDRIMTETSAGNTVAGVLLSDVTEAQNIKTAIAHLQSATQEAHMLTTRLDSIGVTLQYSINDKNALTYKLLRDTTLTQQINNSLQHIEQGTEAFSENMEALKHNFLFRGYFKKKDRKK